MTIEQFIDLIKSIFGDRFAGYRTKILMVVNFLSSASVLVFDDLAKFICLNFNSFCDVKSLHFFVVWNGILSVLVYIARSISTTPPGSEAQFFKRFKGDYKNQVEMLRRKA